MALTSDQYLDLESFEIEPAYPSLAQNSNIPDYLIVIKKLLKHLFNDFSLDVSGFELNSILLQNLPLIKCLNLNTSSDSFSLLLLCNAEYTNGIGRFVPDLISRWLVPGKNLPLIGSLSLAFRFKNIKKKSYYIAEYFISLENENVYQTAVKNIPSIIKELRLIILSVQHARHITSASRLTDQQKQALIQENISDLFEKSLNENVAFDQFHQLFLKISHEKKLSEIRQNLALLMNRRPQAFDKGMFDSMHNLSILFKSEFTEKRTPRHVSRIIGFQYLMKKMFEFPTQIQESYSMNMRVLKSRFVFNNQLFLGILLVIKHSFRFDKIAVAEIVANSLKNIELISDSIIIDYRHDKIFSIYFELQKANKEDFLLEEIELIKKTLPQEMKNRIETTINPVFLPRNEEELIRNIILLTHQLKYVKDIPQVIIAYEKQLGKDVYFSILLVRLLKKNSFPIKDLFRQNQTSLSFFQDEIKIVGNLKKKYPKEANTFKLCICKKPFLRSDLSLDLQKARQTLACELAKVIGDFRDYNGGMISKQTQALNKLKSKFENLDKPSELLVENFFYSLRPGIMQSILEARILKNLFLLFLEILNTPMTELFLITTKNEKEYFYIMSAFSSSTLRDEVIFCIENMKFHSFELSYVSMDLQNKKMLGYIFKSDDANNRLLLYEAVLKLLSPKPIQS